MNTVQANGRQSLFDVAIEHCGTAEAALLLALLNGISLTDDLTVGQDIDVQTIDAPQVVQSFAVNNWQPATATTQQQILDILQTDEGIDFWGIEYDFIVS